MPSIHPDTYPLKENNSTSSIGKIITPSSQNDPSHSTQDKPDSLSLNILYMTKKMQTRNGLNRSEYLRYRKYCNGRIARIRTMLNCQQGKHFKTRHIQILPNESNIKSLELLLMLAERAWGSAMHIKGENQSNRAKFHINHRLRKSIHWAYQLIILCKKFADERTCIEALGYWIWLNSMERFEREKWTESLHHLKQCKLTYLRLLDGVSFSEARDYFQQRLDEIETFSKYSNMNAKKEEEMSDVLQSIQRIQIQYKTIETLINQVESNLSLDILIPKTETVIEESNQEQIIHDYVMYHGQSIFIENVTIRENIAKINHIQSKIDHGLLNDEEILKLFETLLTLFSEAKLTLNNEKTRLMEQEDGTNVEKLNILKNLHEYLIIQELYQMIERNLILTKPIEIKLDKGLGCLSTINGDEAIRFYELINQIMNEIQDVNPSPSIEIQHFYQAQLSYYQSQRCYYLSLLYVQSRDWPESVLLLKRTEEHLALANKFLFQRGTQIDPNQDFDDGNLPTKSARSRLISRIQKHQDRIAITSTWIYAMILLETQEEMGHSESLTKSQLFSNVFKSQFIGLKGGSQLKKDEDEDEGCKDILIKLDSWDATAYLDKIIDFPPKPEPVPCQPVLFEFALAMSQIPDLSERKKEPRTDSGLLSKIWNLAGRLKA